MSSIEKLKIVGIRSFNPSAENVIEFHAPLTIIVGHNGAGKTTIIECLKYATTGEMPPNSKGGAFVHDPKISRDTEVKAQIKLKFKNTRQQTMVVTRSMQLTQTRAKTTLKTLESLLSTVDPSTGEQVSISSRCAQLDAEMPFHLGVSKAVLQNVIFCHQEESLWPLAESAVLKKRFDEIFAAEKYTKALDTLKTVRKQLMQEQKVEEERLAGLKERRELALRLEADIRTAEERIGNAESKIADLDRDINASQELINRHQQDLDRLASIQGEYERLSHELQINQQSRADLSATVSIMNESDDQLTEMLSKLTENSKNSELNKHRIQDRKQATMALISRLDSQQTETLSKRGELTAQIRLGERQLAELESVKLQIMSVLNVQSFEENLVEAEQNEFQNLQIQHRQLEAKAVEEIQNVIGEVKNMTDLESTKNITLNENKRKLQLIKDQIENIQNDLEKLKGLEEDLKRDEEMVKIQREAFRGLDYDSRLSILVERRKDFENQLRMVTSELAEVSKFADFRAQFDVKKNEAKRKEESLKSFWHELLPDLVPFTGANCEVSQADKEIERALNMKQRELRAMTERLDRARQTSTATISKLDHYKQQTEKLESELSEKKRKIEAVCAGDDLNGLIEENENQLKKLSSAINLNQSSKAAYESFAKALSKDHQCPLCERGFGSPSEEQSLAQKIHQFLSAVPQDALDQEQQKRALERKLTELHGLQSVWNDVEKIEFVEMPELARGLKSIEEEKNKALLQVDDLSAEHSTLAQQEKQLTQLKRKTEELARLLRDSKAANDEVSNLENDPSISINNGETLSPTDLQAKSKEIDSALKQTQIEIENLTNLFKEAQVKLTSSESKYREAKDYLMQIQLKASESVRLQEQMVEIELTNENIEQELRDISRKLGPLKSRLEKLKASKETLQNDHHNSEQEARSRLENILSHFNRYKMLLNEASLHQDLQSKLTIIEAELEKISETILSEKEALMMIEEEISISSKAESELLIRERTIKDNLSLRALTRRIEEVRDKADELGSRLGSFDKQKTTDQLNQQQLIHSGLIGERSGLCGELRQLQDQIFRHRQDLQQSFPDYERSYRVQFIRVTAASAAIDDLERYAKALDQAIMRYHGHKMDELNRLIRELWMATYQGADIDTIEIRAAHATEGAARTYNYRVVMLKGDTELDMRGRSSAGQRVLASLIIRLALAETFGQSCGILALDEPTTNLDRDNIEALAASLADIIRARRQQANFQLIIITHDEEFVELLGRHECADYYYRVYKDDSQHSTIEQQAFQGVLS